MSFSTCHVWHGFCVNRACSILSFIQVRSGPPLAVTKLSWLLGTKTGGRGNRVVVVEAVDLSRLSFPGVIAGRTFCPKNADFRTWFFQGTGLDLGYFWLLSGFCIWFDSLPALLCVSLDTPWLVGAHCGVQCLNAKHSPACGARGCELQWWDVSSATWLWARSSLGPFQTVLCGWPHSLKLFPSPVPWTHSWPRKHQVAEIISQDHTIYVGGAVQFT